MHNIGCVGISKFLDILYTGLIHYNTAVTIILMSSDTHSIMSISCINITAELFCAYFVIYFLFCILCYGSIHFHLQVCMFYYFSISILYILQNSEQMTNILCCTRWFELSGMVKIILFGFKYMAYLNSCSLLTDKYI